MADETTVLINDEGKEKIDAKFSVYLQYLRLGHIWIVTFFFSAPLYTLAALCLMGLQTNLGNWVENLSQEGYNWKYFNWSVLLIAGVGVCFTTARFTLRYYNITVANFYFRRLFKCIINAPINLYFHVTLSGTIINRLSKEFNTIDNNFDNNIQDILVAVI